MLVIAFANIFSHCLFILSMFSFAVQMLLSLSGSNLLIFAFTSFALGGRFFKIYCYVLWQSVLRMFSSRSFEVSDFTFRSLILFEFIFIYTVRKCSNLILLYVAVQFSWHHLSKRLFFLFVYSCLLCCRLIDHRCLGLFLGHTSIDLCVCF